MYLVPSSQLRNWTINPHDAPSSSFPTAIDTVCPHCTKLIIFTKTKWGVPRNDSLVTDIVCPSCRNSVQFWIVPGKIPNATPQDFAAQARVYMLPEPPLVYTVDLTRLQKYFPSFVEVFEQAAQADHLKLTQVAGPGYRKALEFLVKEWLINEGEAERKQGQERETIENTSLANCVKKLDSNLAAIGRITVLLGNDETHYKKMFQEYDVTMLRALLDSLIVRIDSRLHEREIIADLEAQDQQHRDDRAAAKKGSQNPPPVPPASAPEPPPSTDDDADIPTGILPFGNPPPSEGS